MLKIFYFEVSQTEMQIEKLKIELINENLKLNIFKLKYCRIA